MEAGMVIAIIFGVMKMAFQLWQSARRIYGKEKIPEWSELSNENKMLQAEIDAELSG